MNNNVPNEYQECNWLFQWAELQPHLNGLLIKICNEGVRSPRQAYQLRAIGLRPGVPDYLLPLANDTYHSLWIEMKRRDKRKTAKDPRQNDWIAKLQKIGHYATYAFGWDDAKDIIERYLANQL